VIWLVAGFIFFFNFSPSFGPAFLYYQTDLLHFSQEFIGFLASLASVGAILGAVTYAPLSRHNRLRPIIGGAIGASVVSTLAYLGYQGPVSAVAIDLVGGFVSMLTQLAFLDLAAKACPRRVEGTFFALLMSISNGGTQLSQNVGGRLYDWVGYTPLVLISAAMTALAWALVPLVDVDRIEAEVAAAAPLTTE
jgi:predicted MFS family arabinose efflux permease